jgi:hypothetical protein
MAVSILIIAILGLFVGGLCMLFLSKKASQLDARVSLWIGYRLFPKKMRRVWGSQDEFKKFLARKKILLVYKTAGGIAVLLAIGLVIFLMSIS